jgi:hypothetical protein
MLTWSASFILMLGVIVSCQATSVSEAVAIDFTACRESLREGADPNGSGGWIMLQSQPRPTLCISGSLEGVDPSPLSKAISETPELDLAVRSTGGPVDVWLGLAEQLLGHLHILYVDEACFSSCANYLLPVARSVVAPENSLVVWHGGPNTENQNVLEGVGVGVAEVIAYDALALRTKRMYAQAGVDVSILSFSARIPEASKASRIVGVAASAVAISGYAMSPRRLSKCFGFSNVEEMWHAGDDEAVYALGRQRSLNLALLESPSIDDGSSACMKERDSMKGAESWELRTR